MSDSPYWGGSSLRNNVVRPLQANTFAEWVARYINVPVSIPMTRKGFLAHPDKNEKKDGPWLSACTYPYEDEGKRGNAHAEQTVLVFFDLDEGPHVKDLFECPAAIKEHLYPYNYAVWCSASHTPEDPRLKLAIDIEACDPALVPRIIAYFADRLGIPQEFKGVVESRTISQGHYRPVKFQGEDFSAVLATRSHGIAFNVRDLPTEEEDLEEFMEGRKFACKTASHDDDTLGLLYLPVVGITVEDIREPLFAIDADCDRKTWIGLCCALRHQFTTEEEAREAYDIFDEWSATGTKYAGEKDTYTRWRSFDAYPEGRAPVTIRSLFKQAQDSGWNSTNLATRLRESTDEWIRLCDSVDELMKEGPTRIADMPFRNNVVEDSLIIMLRDRIKEINGQGIARAAIYKEVCAARRRGKANKHEEMADNLPDWLRPFYFVGSQNVFHNFGTGVQFNPSSFNNQFSVHLMPKDGGEPTPNGKPVILPADFALNLMKIQRVDEMLYNPLRHGEDPIFDIEGRKYLNLYNPLTHPGEDPDRAAEAERLFREHLHVVIGNPEYEEVVIDYLSCLVKWPGRKIPWAILIQSVEGVGKNYLGEIMRGALGKPNVRNVSPEVVCDKWNDAIATDAVLVILNEIHIPGERRERVTNSLKALITDMMVMVNQKFVSPREVPNYVNYFAFTNFRDAIHLKPGDRRWFAIESPIQSKAAVQKLNESGHFERMEPLLNELSGALRYFLKHHKIASDFPFQGPPPMTAFRQEIIDGSTSPMEDAITEIIEGDNPYVGNDVISYNHLVDELPYDVRKKSAKIGHYLNNMGFMKEKKRTEIGGVKTYIWTNRDTYYPELGTPKEILDMKLAVRKENLL